MHSARIELSHIPESMNFRRGKGLDSLSTEQVSPKSYQMPIDAHLENEQISYPYSHRQSPSDRCLSLSESENET
jgi:hypothetical protein